MTSPLVAVVLPAYNEEQTIAQCIAAFAQHLPGAAIYVINNRSTDATASVAEAALEELGVLGGVIKEDRPGKGAAIRRAFLELQADVYLMSDADLTYPADAALALIQPILSGEADMTVGDRLSKGQYRLENKRPFHGAGNRLVCHLVNLLYDARVRDVMSGYRAFSKRFVKTYPILVDGFELETDLTLHALDKRLTIRELAIDYRDRPEGSFSKLNTFRDGSRVLLTIFNIFRHFKPILFFGIGAIFSALLSLIAALPVLEDWLVYRHVYHVPLAVLATGLALTSLLLLTIGLILDTQVRQDRKRFELELLRLSAASPH